MFIETPYPLHKIIDWIGQAQLILEIETGKIPDLRNLSIRTSLDLISFGEEEPGKKVLRGILHPLQEDNANNPIIPRLLSFRKKPHVKRLIEIHDILSKEPKVGDTVADKPIGLAA